MQNLDRLQAFCAQHGIPCERDVPLSEQTTFRIGGPARLLISPGSEEQLAKLLPAASGGTVPLLVLGKGSNILFADTGFEGAVLHIGSGLSGMRLLDEHTIECGAGATLMQLCLFAWERGLSGLEFAYGIPGSVGGAIYMNAGAYGGEMKDALIAARHLGPDGTPGTLEGEALSLSYRHSAYVDSDRVITGGVFRLRPDDKAQIRARMDDYMGRRRDKQPLEYPSAGSTFKRPQGAYASALIDQCGLKGRSVGGARVSEKHAGFVINRGHATAHEIEALVSHIQDVVQQAYGISLETEVCFWGEPDVPNV